MALKRISRADAYSDPIYIGPRDRVELGTSVPPIDEVFASLAYVSEVKKAGRDLFLRSGRTRTEVDSTFHTFRSFIRQARTFYESARTLHHRASALIYYYSFLNLAKAYICLTDPAAVSGKASHGLYYKFSNGKLSTQFLGVEGSGIFRAFYDKLVGQQLPKVFRPNVARLLAYCSDIAYECEQAGFGRHRALPCWHRVLFDQNQTKTAFSLVAAVHFDLLESYKKALKPFFNYYEEVDATQDIPRVASYLGISHPEARVLRYFESKRKYPLDANLGVDLAGVKPDIREAVAPFYLTNPFRSEHQFFMCLPWSKSQQVAFNEIMAIYSFMFFLGSLVRYNPAYLERIIESADSWLIERFVSSCTNTFFRHMSCLILQKDNIYFSR